jgi:hypothetical protein
MKILQLKLSCYMRTDGNTDSQSDRRAVANGRFRKFAYTPAKFTCLQILLDLNAEYSATTLPEFMGLFRQRCTYHMPVQHSWIRAS